MFATDVPAVPTTLFVALVLAASLQGLAAGGHFPRKGAAAPGVGPIVLYGSLAIAALSLAAGIAAASGAIAWYALIIGGGAAVLAAPPVLQYCPDPFVDGRGALIVFAAVGAALAAALVVTALGNR